MKRERNEQDENTAGLIELGTLLTLPLRDYHRRQALQQVYEPKLKITDVGKYPLPISQLPAELNMLVAGYVSLDDTSLTISDTLTATIVVSLFAFGAYVSGETLMLWDNRYNVHFIQLLLEMCTPRLKMYGPLEAKKQKPVFFNTTLSDKKKSTKSIFFLHCLQQQQKKMNMPSIEDVNRLVDDVVVPSHWHHMHKLAACGKAQDLLQCLKTEFLFTKTGNGENVLHIAIKYRRVATVAMLVKEYPQLVNDRTVLFQAIKSGFAEILALLIPHMSDHTSLEQK